MGEGKVEENKCKRMEVFNWKQALYELAVCWISEGNYLHAIWLRLPEV